jgi:hypothetical protein
VARARKKSQLWLVKNHQGQVLANYYALDAKGAVRRFLDDQASQASVFKKSMHFSGKFEDFKAELSPEQPPQKVW